MWDALFMQTAARVRLPAEGRLDVARATADIGTGSYTVMTQVASEALGMPPERIAAQLGDSELPEAPVEGGSWDAASTGAAVQLACHAPAKKLDKQASTMEPKPLGEIEFGAVELRDGR